MTESLFSRLTRRLLSRPPTPARLNLALQGGGAHGAFTWGVLDALLERGHFDLATVSGASAGAMNAVVLAHGLAQSSDPDAARDHAREALHTFWMTVGSSMPYPWVTRGSGDDTRLSPFGQWALKWTQWLSPSQLNPLGANPLRDTLVEQVDFDRLRRAAPIRLMISTTHANSGQLHLFTEREINVDVVLASACLPMIQQAVMLEGEPHWDGGYSANPPLLPLVFDPASAADTLLVPLAPMAWSHTPTTVPEIRERLTELAFNGRFLGELRMLAQWQSDIRWPARGHHERMIAGARWHLVDGAAALASLRGETRLIAHAPFLEHLRDLGRSHALTWIDQHGDKVGQRSSVDLIERLDRRPAAAPPEAAPQGHVSMRPQGDA